MKNTTRKLIKIFMLLFLVAMATSLSAFAAYKIPAKQENVYVYDSENSLRSGIVEIIQELSQQLEELTGIQIFVATFDNLETDNMESVLTSKKVLKKLEDRSKESILIFVSESKNKMHLSASSDELQHCVWPILENYRQLINEGTDYSSAVLNVTRKAIKLICQEKKATFPGIFPEAVVSVKSALEVNFKGLAFKIGIPLAFIVVFGATFVVIVENRKRRG